MTVLLSTLNICFGREIRQLITWYTTITKALDTCHCKLIFTYRFAQNKFLIRFYNKLFIAFWHRSPPLPIMPFLYDVWNVKLQQWAKGLVWSRGWKHFSKTFSIFYMLNSKNRVFNPYFWIGTCPMRIILLPIIREFNLLSFWWKNNHFLWNFCLAIFMGNPSLRLSEVL